MISILLPAGLAFIMFSLGLGSRLEAFRQVARRPAVIGLGLLAQMILLPATALLIAWLLRLPDTWTLGLLVLAVSPGGVTAGMVTRLAGGDTALSISLTAITSLLAFVSVPLILEGGLAVFGGGAFAGRIELPAGQTVGGLVLVTLIPVSLGLWMSAKPWVSAGGRQAVHRAATLLFLLIVVYTFIDQWDVITANLPVIGLACLLLNVLTMVTGFALGGILKLPAPGRIALAMECGIQNSALGITLAVSVLALPQLAVPSVVYALLMNITAFVVILYRKTVAG